jgi:hypothetical protein
VEFLSLLSSEVLSHTISIKKCYSTVIRDDSRILLLSTCVTLDMSFNLSVSHSCKLDAQDWGRLS